MPTRRLTLPTPPALSPRSRHVLALDAPFRLDLTVSLLRRLDGNPVEVWAGGSYLRAFSTRGGPAAWAVRPGAGGATLEVTLHGAAADARAWLTRLRRALGLEVDLAPFHARAARIPALAAAARRVAGVRPPRFASLHEAFASVIPFQQVSLAAAVATLHRLVLALSAPVEIDGVLAWPFPDASAIARAPEATLREAGLSNAKARALQGACAAIASGTLREDTLEPLETPLLLERLRGLPGIGPWSASLLALRGFGRLDVFPPGDAAAGPLLDGLGGAGLLNTLGPCRGMLYYLLFLERARAAGSPAPSLPPRPAAW